MNRSRQSKVSNGVCDVNEANCDASFRESSYSILCMIRCLMCMLMQCIQYTLRPNFVTAWHAYSERMILWSQCKNVMNEFISVDCKLINKRPAIRKNRGGRRAQRSNDNGIPLRTLRPIQEFWASLNQNFDLIFDLWCPLCQPSPPLQSPRLNTSSHYDSIPYIFVLPYILISPLVHNL